MALISLVPIYLGDRQGLVTQLRAALERVFHLTVVIREPWFDAQLSFDAARGQYNSNLLLGQLLTDPENGPSKILGVINRDLFSPALSYVFGEALLQGRAAIVSIERLRNEVYGLPRDDRLLADRLQKEAVHELAHTYGLVHCRDTACVMHPSMFAEQIDFKSARFCNGCYTRLVTGRR